MNQDQVMSAIRAVLMFVGAIATQKGWLPDGSANTLVTDAMAALGPLMVLASAGWGLWVQSHTSKIAAVNAIDGVKVVSQFANAPTVTVAPAK